MFGTISEHIGLADGDGHREPDTITNAHANPIANDAERPDRRLQPR
jgi:hypothetical protein